MRTYHKLDKIDREIFKKLYFGDMIPMAVIKNYDTESRELFESKINMLTNPFKTDEVDFGSIQIEGNEYFIACCSDESFRKNLLNNGKALDDLVCNGNKIECNIFDIEQNLLEPGVVPILSFELRAKTSTDAVEKLVADFSGSAVRMRDYKLSFAQKGKNCTVYMHQLGACDIQSYAENAKNLALKILDEHRDGVQNAYFTGFNGKKYTHKLFKKAFENVKNQDCVDADPQGGNMSRKAEHEVLNKDLREILDVEIGEGRVVASILKNPLISYKNLHRICSDIKGFGENNSEIISLKGQDGDNFLLFTTPKENAGDFFDVAIKIESRLKATSGRSFSIKTQYVDSNGIVSSIEKRLISILHTKSEAQINKIENHLKRSELCAKFEPLVQKYGQDDYGVYVRSISRSGKTHIFNDKELRIVRKEVADSKIKSEMVNAYGERLEEEERLVRPKLDMEQIKSINEVNPMYSELANAKGGKIIGGPQKGDSVNLDNNAQIKH